MGCKVYKLYGRVRMQICLFKNVSGIKIRIYEAL